MTCHNPHIHFLTPSTSVLFTIEMKMEKEGEKKILHNKKKGEKVHA